MLIEKASRLQNQFAVSSARSTHPGRAQGERPLALPRSFLFLCLFPQIWIEKKKEKVLAFLE